MSEPGGQGNVPLDPKAQQYLLSLLTSVISENHNIKNRGIQDVDAAETLINELIQVETNKLSHLMMKNAEILAETENTEKYYQEKFEIINESFKNLSKDKELLQSTKEQKLQEYDTSIRELEESNRQLDEEILQLQQEITDLHMTNRNQPLQAQWFTKTNSLITDVNEFLQQIPEKENSYQKATQFSNDLVDINLSEPNAGKSFPIVSKHLDYPNLTRTTPPQPKNITNAYQQPVAKFLPSYQFQYQQEAPQKNQSPPSYQQQPIAQQMSMPPTTSVQQMNIPSKHSRKSHQAQQQMTYQQSMTPNYSNQQAMTYQSPPQFTNLPLNTVPNQITVSSQAQMQQMQYGSPMTSSSMMYMNSAPPTHSASQQTPVMSTQTHMYNTQLMTPPTQIIPPQNKVKIIQSAPRASAPLPPPQVQIRSQPQQDNSQLTPIIKKVSNPYNLVPKPAPSAPQQTLPAPVIQVFGNAPTVHVIQAPTINVVKTSSAPTVKVVQVSDTPSVTKSTALQKVLVHKTSL